MAATIRDVAHRAGVSPSTVSRVLNNKGVISDETAQRIQKAMEELHYVPNDFARSFATGSAHTIAIVIDVENTEAYSNNFFNDTVFGIETTAHKNDYNLLITNGAEAFGGIDSVERLVLGKKIDGVIISESIANEPFLKRLNEQKFPCVILGRHEHTENEISWVDINNMQAGSLAVRHLFQKGYRKIALITNGDKELFNKDRVIGYCRELQDCNLPFDQGMIIHQISSIDECKRKVVELLKSENPPDAVICSNDLLALGAMRAAKALEIDVPNEFGIVCFDNTTITEVMEPSISSLDVNTYELGVQAADILINQIENPTSSLRQILLSTRMIERRSTQREQGGCPYESASG